MKDCMIFAASEASSDIFQQISRLVWVIRRQKFLSLVFIHGPVTCSLLWLQESSKFCIGDSRRDKHFYSGRRRRVEVWALFFLVFLVFLVLRSVCTCVIIHECEISLSCVPETKMADKVLVDRSFWNLKEYEYSWRIHFQELQDKVIR